MFHIALYEPEIPPNTGNIIRLAANTGCQLELIQPLGFELDEKRLRRAGLDYDEWTKINLHECWESFAEKFDHHQIFAFSTKSSRSYDSVTYSRGDVLLFGPETRGLPAGILGSLPGDQRLRLPMVEPSRSLNLSNTVAIAVYEAWRQNGFMDSDQKN
ncbi:MAG: tRNA (cytidine/uridine-2'-O-)-methyltransferase [Gammaproteobacteria bacterium]|jgi:tRNA (cytidine/uridine-2'-O-)-methyltransferase